MLTVFIVNSLVVAITVVIHYEFLYRMTRWLPKLTLPARFQIVLVVFGALIAHAIEVWVFALTYYALIKTQGWGFLSGNFNGSLLDCAYFSFSTYTTVGFGDIYPLGNLRYLTGIESLTGLVLITWTASFVFIEMQRNWNLDQK
mgnify:CR=1 FL=1